MKSFTIELKRLGSAGSTSSNSYQKGYLLIDNGWMWLKDSQKLTLRKGSIDEKFNQKILDACHKNLSITNCGGYSVKNIILIQDSDDKSYQSIEENIENKINMKENIKEKENILIYLNELIMGYHNRHKNELGGTNISLNKKLKPEDFKNAFIKLGKIYFFF